MRDGALLIVHCDSGSIPIGFYETTAEASNAMSMLTCDRFFEIAHDLGFADDCSPLEGGDVDVTHFRGGQPIARYSLSGQQLSSWVGSVRQAAAARLAAG